MFEPQSGQNLGVWYLYPKLYLNQKTQLIYRIINRPFTCTSPRSGCQGQLRTIDRTLEQTLELKCSRTLTLKVLVMTIDALGHF